MKEWTTVCRLDELVPDRGVAALVGGEQIAVFRLASGELYAVSHRDPATGANVMARGLVGSRGGVPTVCSPLHKEVYDLRTGANLDGDGDNLLTWEARAEDQLVRIRALRLARSA